MDKIKLLPTVLVHEKKGLLLLLEMGTMELYQVDGDVGVMIQFIHKKYPKATNLEEILGHLNKKSEDFKNNPNPTETVKEALSYLQNIKIIG